MFSVSPRTPELPTRRTDFMEPKPMTSKNKKHRTKPPHADADEKVKGERDDSATAAVQVDLILSWYEDLKARDQTRDQKHLTDIAAVLSTAETDQVPQSLAIAALFYSDTYSLLKGLGSLPPIIANLTGSEFDRPRQTLETVSGFIQQLFEKIN